MKLNLEAKTKEQELVKQYLEDNASQTLAEKINNGTPFEKDGKILTNKKTLDSFMKYASDEARKLASKGASCACVEDKVVFGWAIHYFEEDSIEETLYNEDGTEYKPAPKYTTPAKVKKVEPEKPKQQQVSLFDFMDSEQKEDIKADSTSEEYDEYEELTEEEMREFDGDIDEPKNLLDKIEDDLQNNTSDNNILSTLKRIFENNIIVR